ncbi:hypothetical protein CPB83DRAFT_849645 [Crepidotus variabilis]|uniref:Phosphoinositide phospholipase C n=1 Tax=Crepidotus variabilis TaxID=179855 RepID=A0A9P6ELE3_9AGAR|nr:hypothetical protein CPB83DRAFT_849645 [Crepidotus variabilis]
MQDLPLTSRTLKRASGLVSSNGRVVKELVDMEAERDSDAQLSSSTKSSLKGKNGFGASFRRKFQDFRDRNYLGRSKSLNDSETASAASPTNLREGGMKGRGHSRSLSEAPKKPSSPIHTNSAPPALRRNSTQVRPPPLHSVAEGETVHHTTPTIQTVVPLQHEFRSPTAEDITVPILLQQGVPMTKVTMKKHKKVVFRIDADQGQLVWEGRKKKIIPIENIKEIRAGADARYYRQQFQLSKDYQDRWLTLIYIIDGEWKTLHLIADTIDLFEMWNQTLRGLHAIRKELMQGLGNFEVRQAMWEKQYWKGADEEGDEELSFEEVEKLCRKLNINTSRDDLERLFTQADRQQRQFLDFEDFRRFVKLLKGRPEVDRRYKKLRAEGNGHFDFDVFEKFMVDTQKSSLPRQELRRIFDKYSTSTTASDVPGPAMLTLDAFTSFLLSSDNSAFADQHRDEWHEMTHPLPEYFISSSHNTYLVGHQLVGDSTIEGYIRALLQGCRSVEVDIYDGEDEPMIFHGKTLTSKVSLREVCEAIIKYGFVASPYPIIISAEVHCGLAQQDLIAKIMIEVFGEALVKIPPEGIPRFEQLPSPTDLKGKILFKTKNTTLSGSDTLEGDSGETSEPSSSASDSDAFYDAPQKAEPPTPRTPAFPGSPPATPAKAKPQRRNSEQMKEQFTKAKTTFLQRVRSVRGAPSSTPVSSPTLLLSQAPPSLDPLSPVTPLPNIALSSLVSPPSTALIRSPTPIDGPQRVKPKLSFALVALLVYTVGVKCRGINKKEEYAPEHMFSLSENAANRMLRFNMRDLIKHTRTHLVRTYPKGTRLRSTNYDPHRFWVAGAQVVAINWQTFDLGYMINYAMFQRNGRTGYVLKPAALRQHAPKELLNKQTRHTFDVTVISAQQLPRPRSSSGKETSDKVIVDPFVEVTLFIPDWPVEPENKNKDKARAKPKERGRSDERTDPVHTHPRASSTAATSTPARAPSARTSVVKKNGFNPVWEDKLSIPFDCVGDMFDLIFVKFAVKQEDKETDEPLAVYCASLGSLQQGYRHIPLHDSQLSQYLYSTLFVKINVNNVTPAIHI